MKKKRGGEISPDEIFLDSANLPAFDRTQCEGRLEQPLGMASFVAAGVLFFLIALVFSGRLWQIQVADGAAYAERSRNNTLKTTPLFAERGNIFDRTGALLAWNEPDPAHSEFFARRYASVPGSAHIVGYLKYPTKDSSGFYYRNDFTGDAGAERAYNEALAGTNGVRTVELNVRGETVSESTVTLPRRGNDIHLSVDARFNEALYGFLMERVNAVGFRGGAAVLMDVTNGEIIAETSAPEYSPQILSDGKDAARIAALVNDPRHPFLDRASVGLYAPGSTVKPFLAAAALQENVVTPDTKIVSTGSLSIPNPYAPGTVSVFNDWKAHGAVDMRRALAVSSDVYFYEIGGGFENQPGLGIGRIEKYLRLFGFGAALADPLLGGASGTIPSPAWKATMFPDDPWRIGDTYHTAIGQYGTLVTPLQMVRAVAAIANGGTLFEPTLIAGDTTAAHRLPLSAENIQVAQDGMRLAVTEGTASGLSLPYVAVAGKTGTAEVGTAKKLVHSWVVGFYPASAPHYAFTVLLERGPSENTVGGVYVMRRFFEWLFQNAPEYLK